MKQILIVRMDRKRVHLIQAQNTADKILKKRTRNFNKIEYPEKEKQSFRFIMHDFSIYQCTI